MFIEIKHRWTGGVLFRLECGSVKEAVEKAVAGNVSLAGANLAGAYLMDAKAAGRVPYRAVHELADL